MLSLLRTKLKPVKLKHAFSTVADGNMSFKWGSSADVCKNRLDFLKKHNLKESSAICSAINGDNNPRLVTAVHAGSGITNPNTCLPGHALFTTKPNLALMLLTADCMPAIVYSETKPAVLVMHLSAQTIDTGLIEKSINALLNHTELKPSDLQVLLGPHIHAQSYYHKNPPVLSNSCWLEAVNPKDIRTVRVDIKKAALVQFAELGVNASSIVAHPADTYTDSTYFSHYRSHQKKESEGRFATIAWLE